MGNFIAKTSTPTNKDIYITCLDKMEKGFARILNLLKVVSHRIRRNSLRGSRHNISDHYDLSNDLFELFLDPTLAYSCAIFPETESTLEEASNAKFDHICRKLNLTGQDHVLEIGSGWGGFALHAAKHYGCRVTTTTLSRQQYEYVKRTHKFLVGGKFLLKSIGYLLEEVVMGLAFHFLNILLVLLKHLLLT